MDPKTQALFDNRAGVLKALAHPSRLYMVTELGSRELCVSEMAGMIGADMSTASKHLAVLKAAGIVRHEKRGSQVFYNLKIPCVLRFIDCVEAALKSSAKETLDLHETESK